MPGGGVTSSPQLAIFLPVSNSVTPEIFSDNLCYNSHIDNKLLCKSLEKIYRCMLFIIFLCSQPVYFFKINDATHKLYTFYETACFCWTNGRELNLQWSTKLCTGVEKITSSCALSVFWRIGVLESRCFGAVFSVLGKLVNVQHDEDPLIEERGMSYEDRGEGTGIILLLHTIYLYIRVCTWQDWKEVLLWKTFTSLAHYLGVGIIRRDLTVSY